MIDDYTLKILEDCEQKFENMLDSNIFGTVSLRTYIEYKYELKKQMMIKLKHEFIDKDNFCIALQAVPVSIAMERNTITEQEIVKPYLDKLKADIKKEYDRVGLVVDFGCGLIRAYDIIDNFLSEIEVDNDNVE